MIVLGVAYMLLFLPHTIPDEPVHYFNAYNISNYFTFNFKQSNSEFLLMRESDLKFFEATASTNQSAEYYKTILNGFSVFSLENALVENIDVNASL